MTQNRQVVIHKHSKVLSGETTPKAPSQGVLEKGEIAINYNNSYPSIFIETEDGTIARFVDKTYVDTKESSSNKVTALTSGSTDTQYPSAKVVYDSIIEVEEVASAAINDLNDRVNTISGSSHTHSNYDVLSAITSTKVSNWDTAYASAHTHANKTALDSITSTKVSNWDSIAENGATKTYANSASGVAYNNATSYTNTNFVKKESGKELIATSAITKLDGIATGAQVNVLEGVQVNGSDLSVTSKKVNVTVTTGSANGTIAVNGSNVSVKGLGSAAYTESSAYDAAGKADTAYKNATSYTNTNFVQKESGKGLSTNDYTTAEKNKLASAETTTNKVTTLTSGSTDTQYPSAKVVYDTITDNEKAISSAFNVINNKISTLSGSSHSHSNKSILDTITSTKTSNWDTAYTSAHSHTNKSVLDTITSTKVSNWDSAEANVITGVSFNGTHVTPVSKEVSISATTETQVNNMINQALTSTVTYKGATASVPSTSAKVGDEYIASAAFTVPSGKSATSAETKVEISDFIIARNSGTTFVWDVIQKNIDGAVTSTNDSLTAGYLIVGNGARTITNNSDVKAADIPTKIKINGTEHTASSHVVDLGSFDTSGAAESALNSAKTYANSASGVAYNNATSYTNTNFVKKESGKGLSTNDYTTAEKNKLASAETTTNKVTTLSSGSTDTQYPSAKVVYDTISANEEAVSEAINSLNESVTVLSGQSHTHSNKSVLDGITSTKVSNWDSIATNGASKEYANTTASSAYNNATSYTDTNYVKKDGDKVLSDNNYTDAEKSKLLNIATGAQVNVLEGVQVNGSDLSISSKKVNVTVATGSANGTIAVNGSDISVKGLGSAAYQATTAFDTAGAAASAVAALDASKSGSNNGVTVKVDQLNGLITGVTVTAPATHTHDNKSVLDSITSTNVSNWDNAATNSHTHSNYNILSAITSTNISNWNTGYASAHSHSNISVLDAITSTKTTNWDNAATNSHTHSNYNILSAITSTNISNWNTAYASAHSHTNKSVLDGITSAKVSNWDSMASGAYLPLSGGTMTGAITSQTIVVPAAYSIELADGSGNQYNVFDYDSWGNGSLLLGKEFAAAGKDTYVEGNHLYLRTGSNTLAVDINQYQDAYFKGNIGLKNNQNLQYADENVDKNLIGTDDGGEVQVGNSSDDIYINGGNYATIKVNNSNVIVADYSQNATFSNNVYVNGTLTANTITAAGEVTAYSDRRLKSNIKDLENRGLLSPKTYVKDNKEQIGFIAQDVEELYPELVSEDAKGYKSLNYMQLTAVLSAQINELTKQVEKLSNRIKELEEK